MRVVHAADLHLDSPLRGLSRYPGAPEEDIRGAARTALENLVELTIRQDAAALLLAGDIYDGDWRDYNTGLFFGAQMRRLREAGVPVFLIRGNHDADSRITRTLPMPDNVHEFRTDAAESVIREDLGIAVHGQGFARPDIRENLAYGYPEPLSGLANIGLLHTAVAGSSEHAPYAPCSLAELQDKGYDYWALGHIHQAAVLSSDPYVVFPGNLQGRHARETGPKGATVVEIDDGRCVSVTAHALDVVRWERLSVDVTGCADFDEVSAAVDVSFAKAVDAAEGRLLAARVELSGDAAAQGFLWRDQEHTAAQVRMAATAVDGLWAEKVLPVAVHRADAPALSGEAVDGLRQAARTLRGDAAALREAAHQAGLDKHVGHLAQGGLDLADPDTLARLLDGALELLVAAVAPAGGGAGEGA